MPQGSQLDGGRELAIISQENPLLGSLLAKHETAINKTSTNAQVSSISELPAPPPIDSISVAGSLNTAGTILTAPGEFLHWTHIHNVPVNRGINYSAEIDTDPSFSNPHPIDQGFSRSGFTTLPTNNSLGSPVSYYLRGLVQYPGSAPAKPTVYGGLQGPIKIVFSGSTNATLLASQSGGTAHPGQGGQGLGKVLTRTPLGPKRDFST